MNRVIFSTICLALSALPANAQFNKVFDENIASLRVVAGDDWTAMPIINLNGNVPINISFDDLTHEYHRYTYRLEHCEADWTKSEGIFPSDYCEGFAEGNTIDDVEESINTNIQYSHYSLQIPNEKCKVKISGNYRLTVYDENTNSKMLEACFMVKENTMPVRLEASTNTDIDINGAHQQISMEINYGANKVINPRQEIKTVVLQNGRWDNAVYNPTPQYIMPDGLKWQHNRQLIFDGGNEYRKFETLDVSHSTMGIESVEWDGSNYNAYVWTDEPRPNYIYDEDANGAFTIRNSDNIENNTSSEYVLVHFRLKSEPINETIFINGNWTNETFIPKYEMKYNSQSHLYEAEILLKQGYYSYQYLSKGLDGKPQPASSEGNFSQTENDYVCLVYFKGTGQRTDKLVGFQRIKIN